MKLSDKVQKSLDQVVTMFKDGNLPEKISQSYIKGEGRPSDKWSLLNRVIMFAHDTMDARGYKQWQKVDRQVTNGVKAIYILGPITKKVTEEKETEDGIEEVEKIITIGFHGIPVFRYEDTEGESLPDYTPRELPPLANVLDNLGYEIEYRPYGGGARGSMSPDLKKVELMTEDERTFFHELSHVIHSEIEETGLRNGQHSKQEIVAETVAATLCQIYGYEHYLQHSQSYIEAYSNNGNAYLAVAKYVGDVEKVLDHLFELEGVNV